MAWQIMLKDGSRHPVSGEIHFDTVRGTKRICPSHIDGSSEIFVKAAEQHDVVLESPHGHHYKASVEMVDGKWRVVGV